MEEDIKVLAKLLRSQVQQLIKEREEREERRTAQTPVVATSSVSVPPTATQQQQPTPAGAPTVVSIF